MIDPIKLKEDFIRIVCLDTIIDNLQYLKYIDVNIVSIRSVPSTRPGIINHDSRYAKIDEMKFQNIYVSEFDDLAKESERKHGKFPTYEQIVYILKWAQNRWDANQFPFIVHCTAGISRSSAVAILIRQMIKGDGLKALNPKIHYPNLKVIEYGEKYLNINHLTPAIIAINKEWEKRNQGGVSF